MSLNLRRIAVLAVFLGLTGCYVVPIGQPVPTSSSVTANAQVAQTSISLAPLTARLYPTNEAATSIGRLSGTISRPENGHGIFSLTAKAENYSGEATRTPNSSKGIANAAGSQGGYIKCEYTMNNATNGTGVCVFSNGARFDMHISE
jgi:hypothetical protein